MIWPRRQEGPGILKRVFALSCERLCSGGQGMCAENAGRHWVATGGEGKKSWFALH